MDRTINIFWYSILLQLINKNVIYFWNKESLDKDNIILKIKKKNWKVLMKKILSLYCFKKLNGITIKL